MDQCNPCSNSESGVSVCSVYNGCISYHLPRQTSCFYLLFSSLHYPLSFLVIEDSIKIKDLFPYLLFKGDQFKCWGHRLSRCAASRYFWVLNLGVLYVLGMNVKG